MSIVYEIVNEMTVQQLHGAIYSPVQATGVGLICLGSRLCSNQNTRRHCSNRSL